MEPTSSNSPKPEEQIPIEPKPTPPSLGLFHRLTNTPSDLFSSDSTLGKRKVRDEPESSQARKPDQIADSVLSKKLRNESSSTDFAVQDEKKRKREEEKVQVDKRPRLDSEESEELGPNQQSPSILDRLWNSVNDLFESNEPSSPPSEENIRKRKRADIEKVKVEDPYKRRKLEEDASSRIRMTRERKIQYRELKKEYKIKRERLAQIKKEIEQFGQRIDSLSELIHTDGDRWKARFEQLMQETDFPTLSEYLTYIRHPQALITSLWNLREQALFVLSSSQSLEFRREIIILYNRLINETLSSFPQYDVSTYWNLSDVFINTPPSQAILKCNEWQRIEKYLAFNQFKLDKRQQIIETYRQLKDDLERIDQPNLLLRRMRALYATILQNQVKESGDSTENKIVRTFKQLKFHRTSRTPEIEEISYKLAELLEESDVNLEIKLSSQYLIANHPELVKQLLAAPSKSIDISLCELILKALIRSPGLVEKASKVIAALSKKVPKDIDDLDDIDFRQCMIIFGDAFLKGSGIEGDRGSYVYVDILRDFFKKNPEYERQYPDLFKLLTSHVDLNFSEESGREKLGEIIDTIKSQVDTTGCCLLTGGWKGHAIVYTIHRQENDRYCFGIYNAGDGIEYQVQTTIGAKKKVRPCLIIKDITKDHLFQSQWLENLVLLTQMDERPGSPPPSFFLYRVFLSLLQGNILSEKLGLDDLMTPQRSGTCTWKSLCAVLATHMNKHDFRVLKLRIKQHVLNGYYNGLKRKLNEGFPPQLVEIRALEHLAIKFSTSLLRLLETSLDQETMSNVPQAPSSTELLGLLNRIKRGVDTKKPSNLDSQEIVQAQQLIEHIVESIAEVKAIIIKSNRQSKLDLSKMIGLPQLVQFIPPFSIYGGVVKFKQSYLKKNEQISSATIMQKVGETYFDEIIIVEKILNWNPRRESIAEELRSFCSELIRVKSLNVVLSFEYLVDKLMDANVQEPKYFEEVPIEEIFPTLKKMHELAKHVFDVQRGFGALQVHFKETAIAAQIYWLVTMDKLYRKQPFSESLIGTDTDDIAFYILTNAYNGTVPFYMDSWFRVIDPKWNRQLKMIADQYSEKNALFGMHHFSYVLKGSKRFTEVMKLWMQDERNRDKIRKILPKAFIMEEEELFEKIWLLKESALPKPFILMLKHNSLVLDILGGPKPTGRTSDEIPLEDLAKKSFSEISQFLSLIKSSERVRRYFARIHWVFSVNYRIPENAYEAGVSLQLFSPRRSDSEIINNLEIPQKVLHGSVERYRELLYLRSSPQIQIPATLSFFSKHISLLASSDYQRVLFMLLFEGTVLEDDLLAYPQRSQLLTQFMLKTYVYFKGFNDARTAAFVLYTGSCLKRLLQFELIRDTLAEIDYWIKGVELKAKSTEEGQETLALLHLFRSAIYSNYWFAQKHEGVGSESTAYSETAIDIEWIEKLLISNLYRKFLPLKLIDFHCCQLSEALIFQLSPHIGKFFSKPLIPEAIRILNKMIMHYAEAIDDANVMEYIQQGISWSSDSSFPIFQSSDGTWQVNILSGEVNVLMPIYNQMLPQYIQDSKDFVSLFGSYKPKCMFVNAGTVEFIDPFGKRCRVYTNYKDNKEEKLDMISETKVVGNISITKFLEGTEEEYLYIPPGHTYSYLDSNVQVITDSLPSFPSFLLNNYQLWIKLPDISYDDYSDFPITVEQGILIDPHTQLPSFIIQNGIIWEAEDGQKSNWMLINLCAKTLENIESRTNLSKIHDEAIKAFKEFSNFEVADQILVFREEKKPGASTETVGCKIWLPRYELNFTWDSNSLKWVSTEYPGFFLARQQYLSVLEHCFGIFVLENNRGQQKVLIPNRDIEVREKCSLDFPVHFIHESTHLPQPAYCEYNINQGVLVPLNLLSRLQLATIYLLRRNYEQAYQLIKISEAEITERPFTSGEKICLERLIQPRKPTSIDDWGPAVAIRLHAFYLLANNILKTSNDRQQLNILLRDNYIEWFKQELINYWNQINNTGPYSLDLFEEQFLIRCFIKCCSEVSLELYHRCRELQMPEASTLQQRILKDSDGKFGQGTEFMDLSNRMFILHDVEPDLAEIKKARMYYKSSKKLPFETALLHIDLEDGKIKAVLADYFEDIYNSIREIREDENRSDKLKWVNILLPLLFRKEVRPMAYFYLMVLFYPEKFPFDAKELLGKFFGGYDISDDYLAQEMGDYLQNICHEQKLVWLKDFPVLSDLDKYLKSIQKSAGLDKGISTHLKPERKYKDVLIPPRTDTIVPTDLGDIYDLGLKIVYIDDYFHKVVESQFDQSAWNSIKHAFYAAFSEDNRECSEIIVKNQYAAMKEDLDVCLLSKKALAVAHYEISTHDLNELIYFLEQRLKETIEDEILLEASILNLVSQLPKEPTQRSLFTGAKLSLPNLHEVLIYFAQNNWEGLVQRNPYLTKEDLIQIREKTFSYLFQQSRGQKIRRCLEKASSLQQMEQGETRHLAVQSLVQEIENERVYASQEYPAYLVFECLSSILLRQDQVNSLELFLSGRDIQPVLQLIMGAGKTSTLLPLLGFVRANGKNISAIVVPESLLADVMRTLRSTLGEGFDQLVCYISFDRRNLSIEYFKELYNLLIRIKEKRQCAIFTPHSIHSLNNGFEEILYQLANDSISLEEFKVIQKVYSLLKENLDLILDEADQILNPRLEFNFPVGDKKIVDNIRAHLITKIVFLFVEDQEIQGLIVTDFSMRFLQRQGRSRPSSAQSFSPKLYVESVRPLLVQKALEFLSMESVCSHRAVDYRELFQRLSSTEHEYLRFFLLESSHALVQLHHFWKSIEPCKNVSISRLYDLEAFASSKSQKELLEWIARDRDLNTLSFEDSEKLMELIASKKKMHASIDSFIVGLPPALREDLTTIKLLLNKTLPSSLSKICNEKYGYKNPHHPKDPIACPWAAADDPKTTEFESIEDQIVYSVQNILQNEISIGIIKEYLLNLQMQAKRSLRIAGKVLEETQAFKEFVILRGPYEQLSLLDLDESGIRSIAEHINKDPAALLFILPPVLFSKIELASGKFSSNPQKLSHISHSLSGFTGTLWNSSCYPRSMIPVWDKGVDSKTLVAIYEKLKKGNSSIENVPLEGKELCQYLNDNLANASNTNTMVLIDSGGWLKDIKLEIFINELHKQLHEARPYIKGIVCHSSSGQLICSERRSNGSISSCLLEESLLKEDERLTIITQKYCTGTNVRQKSNAKALMTINKAMNLRDFLQSVFRMRGILQQQNVDLLLAEEDCAAIREILHLPMTKPIEFSDLIRFLTASQALHLADDNWVATKQRMSAILQELVFNAIFGENHDVDFSIKVFKQAQYLFYIKESDFLYQQYGFMGEYVSSEECIQQLALSHVRNFVTILKDNTQLIQIIALELYRRLEQRGVSLEFSSRVKFEEYLSTISIDRSIEILSGMLQQELLACADPQELRSSLPRISFDTENEVERERENENEMEKEKQIELEKDTYDYIANLRKESTAWKELLMGRGNIPDLNQWRTIFQVESGVKRPYYFGVKFSKKCFYFFRETLPGQYSEGSISKAIDSDIAVSADFLGKECPFGTNRQSVSYQVLVVHEGDHSLCYILNPEEASQVAQSILALVRSDEGLLENKNISFALMEPDTGIIVSSLVPGVTLQVDPGTRLFQQMTQIKFLTGSLHYSDDELKYLRIWIKENNPTVMEKFFREIVLSFRDDAQLHYQHSPLGELLGELAGQGKIA